MMEPPGTYTASRAKRNRLSFSETRGAYSAAKHRRAKRNRLSFPKAHDAQDAALVTGPWSQESAANSAAPPTRSRSGSRLGAAAPIADEQ